MAIDTQNKRRSAGAHPLTSVLPVPDGSIDKPDRAQVGWIYSGIVIISGAAATEARKFRREPIDLVTLFVTGDVAGQETFRFSNKEGRPLTIPLMEDIRPYILRVTGRPTRIEPDKAITQRGRITIEMADDPNAPPFDSAIFSIVTGGSFWRRLELTQPDIIGTRVEVRRGYFFDTIRLDSFDLIFRGRLEEIHHNNDGSVRIIAKDDLALNDRQIPSEISDDNLLNGAVGIADATITVDKGSEITDPANLDSKDFWPVVLRLDPGGADEDVAINSVTGNVATVQANFIDKSEKFDDAAWAKTATTVTADAAIGPFGGDPRADLLVFAASGSLVENDSGVTATGEVWTFSVWLRNAATTTADPATYTLELKDSVTTHTLQINVTKGAWTRFEVSGTLSSGTVKVRIIRASGDTGEDVLAYGGQLEKASTRGFYIATDGNDGADAGRGAFGSTAAAHADDKAFTEVIPYRLHRDPESGVHPVVAMRDLVNRLGIAKADVDQAVFDGEFTFIESFQVKRAGTSIIDESRKALEHVKELSQQALLVLWISETGLVRTRWLFRQNLPGANTKTITDEANVIEGSHSLDHNAESRITRAIIHFNLKSGAEGNKPEDFTNHQITVDLGVEAASGEKARSIFSKWLFRSAEAVATAGRLVSRFKRAARKSKWTLDVKDDPDFFMGDVIEFDSPDVLQKSGSAAVRGKTNWQVVQKRFNRDRGQIGVEGLEFSGLRYAIISQDEDLETPPDDFPDFNDASGAERQFGFIGTGGLGDATTTVGTPSENGYYIL